MRWIIVLLLLVLGWSTVLTVQVTDLYDRNTALQERCNKLEAQSLELKRELEKTLELYKENMEHTLQVHKELLDATIKGVLEEW